MKVYSYTNVKLSYKPTELHQYKMTCHFLREGSGLNLYILIYLEIKCYFK